MYSLIKDLKYPQEWFSEPAKDSEKMINDLFKECVEMGLFQDDRVNFKYFHGFQSIVGQLYPKSNLSQLMEAARFNLFIFLIDDFLDSTLLDESSSNKIVSKIIEILILGDHYSGNEIKNKIEKFVLYYINNLKEYCVNNNISDERYNLFIKNLIDWVDSCQPFKKAVPENNDPLHYETYRYFKKINALGYGCSAFSWIMFPESNCNTNLFFNPIYDRMLSNASNLIALMNDFCSYVKEIRNGEHHNNSLYFLQQRDGGKSFEETYKFLLLSNHQSINQIQSDELLLLSSIKNEDELPGIKIHIDALKSIIAGNFNWSITCSRYASDNDSLFIELQNSSTTDIKSYDTIVSHIYK